MSVTTLDPVEVYTPNEVSRILDIEIDWLHRRIRLGEVKASRSAWLPLIPSTDLPKIEALHSEWEESKAQQRAANKRYQKRKRRQRGN